jgi:hypothetical protein
MTLTRYEAQIDRLVRIAESMFPNCRLFFGTAEKPKALSLEITDSTNTQRICLFPKPTAVEGLEEMSDELVALRFEECAKLWGYSAVRHGGA